MGASSTASRAKSPTRATRGPERAASDAEPPRASRSGPVAAEMNSPHTLRRGKGAFSTIATTSPARASSSAAADPAGPAPATIAS
jgi:hypothetical protein